MPRIPVPVLVLFAAGALHSFASAQQTPAVQSMAASEAQQICAREFGEQFKLDPKFAPITADLDGDGQEDLVLVATAKNPLSGEMDYHYRAIDPYDGYFGWSNAKDTLQFSATNAGTTRYVLVVHSWRTPKDKFALLSHMPKHRPVLSVRLGFPSSQRETSRLGFPTEPISRLHFEGGTFSLMRTTELLKSTVSGC